MFHVIFTEPGKVILVHPCRPYGYADGKNGLNRAVTMAANGRKDVFRARSGEKPTGQKGMEMGEEREREEICIADIAVRVSNAMEGRRGRKKWVGEGRGTIYEIYPGLWGAAFFLQDEPELQGVRQSLTILTTHFFLEWLEISGSYLVCSKFWCVDLITCIEHRD